MFIVTGGAGFIGSAIIWKLNEVGISDILVVDDLESGDKWKNLVKRRITNIVSIDGFQKMMNEGSFSEKVDAVFHMGACSATTEKDMDYLLRNNVHYSMDVFKFCTKGHIPLIYASSAATYGNGENGYEDSEDSLNNLRPINKYGYSKQFFDSWVLKQKKMPPFWAGLKFFNVYGPQEYHKDEMKSVVAKALLQIQDTDTLKLFKSYREGIGDGEQQRDFVYIKDVVDVCFHLYETAEKSKSGIYNVGTGKARSFADLGKGVFKAMGYEKENFTWIEMPESIRDQYQYFTEATMSKLKENTLYSKKFFSLEDGIEDYVKNYLLGEDPYL